MIAMPPDLILGDCLEVLPSIPDNSVNLIYTDPPYYKVKSEAWDRQWDKPAQFLGSLGANLRERLQRCDPGVSFGQPAAEMVFHLLDPVLQLLDLPSLNLDEAFELPFSTGNYISLEANIPIGSGVSPGIC